MDTLITSELARITRYCCNICNVTDSEGHVAKLWRQKYLLKYLCVTNVQQGYFLQGLLIHNFDFSD